MQYTIPHYYKNFRCIGGSCPDTCCAGWQIQIDDGSLRKYKSLRGPLGSRLKNEIDWKEGCFRQYNGRCAFLNDENLCDLYLEGGGQKAFCRTCRTYPRHVEEFEGLREISLSLSCPAAAKLILSGTKPVHFLHGENEKEDSPYDDLDFFLFTKLMDARVLILRILQDRTHSVSVRSAICLSFAHDLQLRIDRGALFCVDDLIERYASPSVWTWFEERLLQLKNRNGAASLRISTQDSLFSLLSGMEILREDWKPFLNRCARMLKSIPFPEDISPFKEVFTDVITEQLLVYFVFTYFCGAVYNGNAYGKMKFALAGTLLIRDLVLAQWLSDPSRISQDTVLCTAWRYAREIEHSDLNKTKMEQQLSDEAVFSLEGFFSLL